MKKLLITGGAGFIGVNCARYFYNKGFKIDLFDNLSRRGSKFNLNLLLRDCPNINIIRGDISNFEEVKKVFKNNQYDLIIHLAAQVAVTTSVEDPLSDFYTNALGSLNLLECVRRYNPEAVVIYSSTNKVYGSLENLDFEESERRYILKNFPDGIPETICVDFHSPYGCSKGCADFYFIDYHRIYNLKTVVLRQSCIYGPYQFGIEDQGWIAWFLICSQILKRTITIYGNGKQVRDILFIDDLVELYFKLYEKITEVAGKFYNIGGGMENALSILEFIDFMINELGINVSYKFDTWRPGDQKVFICKLDKIYTDVQWKPRVNYKIGLQRLNDWICKNKELIFQAFEVE